MVRIVTDSTSDITPERREELNIDVLPLLVRFGGETFRDGVDITHAQFYERLSSADTLPTTSQVNPDEFAAVFKRYAEAGDQVVGIFFSSDLSGTCQSAFIAREMVGSPDIFVLDSRTVTIGLRLLVEQAVRLRDAGLDGPALAAALPALIARVRLFATLDSLKYLKLGGRISSTSAAIGELLGIAPIIAVQGGKVDAVGKARGRKAAFEWIGKRMDKEPHDPSLPVVFGHSGRREGMEECMAFFADRINMDNAIAGDIGSVVGTHIGPGAAGIAYFMK